VKVKIQNNAKIQSKIQNPQKFEVKFKNPQKLEHNQNFVQVFKRESTQEKTPKFG
jgi:hypothetical protein